MQGFEIAALGVATAIGGVIRGFAGFGGPLLLIPIFNLHYAPATTVAVVLTADTIASLQLMPGAWREAKRKVLGLLLFGSLVSIPAGAALLLWTDPKVMKTAISAVIMILALLVLWGWRYNRPLGTAGYIGVGALGGAVVGATGIAAVVPLFLSAGHDTAAQNRAHFILWVALTYAVVVGLIFLAGRTSDEVIRLVLFMLPLYWIGVIIGSRSVRRVSDAKLRTAVLCLVLIVALGGLIF